MFFFVAIISLRAISPFSNYAFSLIRYRSQRNSFHFLVSIHRIFVYPYNKAFTSRLVETESTRLLASLFVM